MAFTNYLSQSLIGAVIFYGFSLGLYETLQRYEVYPIDVVIIISKITFSYFWLKYYSMGPLEWMWRQLTYWKKLPLSKTHK